MSSHYHSPDSLRKKINLLAVFFLIVTPLLYGAFRIYPLLRGPTVVVAYPYDGATVSSSTFVVKGTAERASTLLLQGKPITINEQGVFSETLVASTPYTILILVATDKYGTSATTTLRVIHKK